jgi:hypothetical protein
MKNLFLLTCVACLIAACKSKRDLFDSKRVYIQCEQINDQIEIGVSLGMILTDSVLILNDFQTDPILTVLNINNNATIGKFLRNGKGPGECIPPVQLQILNDSLYILERQTMRLYAMSMAGIYDNGAVRFDKIWESKSLLNTFIPLSRTLYLASGHFSEARFALLNESGEVVKLFGEYPAFMSGEKDYSNEGKSMFHQTFFLKKKNSDIIAAITPHVLELYSCKGEDVSILRQVLLAEYNYSSRTGEIMQATSDPDTKRGGTDFYATEKYIYIVFNPNHESSYRDPNRLRNEILIFDWEGAPVKALLPDKNIYTIAVTENDGTIYATDADCVLYKIHVDL